MRKILKNNYPGRLITFEGPEGAGKSTQLKLLAAYLREKGFEVIVTREPGGTPLAEHLRSIVKAFEGEEKLHATTELLLIEAARSQHVREVIRPALAAGKMVLCDRYLDSTAAYQGGGRSFDAKTIDLLNDLAVAECVPDLTLLLDLSPEAGLSRTSKRVETQFEHDRFEEENLEFHRQVRESYLAIAERNPERIRVLAADRPVPEIFNEVRKWIDELI